MPDHVPLPGSERPPQREAQRIREPDDGERLEVTIALTDQATAQGVSDVLQRHGLTVVAGPAITRSLRATGTVAQFREIFQPQLGVYQNPEQGEFRGREGDLKIPAELDGLIEGVFGFDQRRVAWRRSSATAAQAQPLSPAQIADHYDFPAGDGAGQTIAIAEFGGGYFAEDLTAFCAKQGTAVPEVTPVGVNGTPVLTLAQIEQLPAQPRQQQLEDSVEVNMDVQIVAGLAPGADQIVYFSSFDEKGWVDLINEVISREPAGALALSISWGLAEDDPDWSQAALQAIDARLQSAAALGITVCAAAGDDGSADQETDGRAHVDFPASSPHVLAVGGTMLDGAVDVVWWESPGQRTGSGGGATGGGVSVVFPRPSWQNVKVTSLNSGSIDGRVIPDIAALAGPPLYDLVMMGKDSPNGGTSASTPTWAALLALMAAAELPWGPAFLAPLLYANGPSGRPVGQVGCTDVTSGDNASSTLGRGYEAGPGFDAVSGWGVPNGAALLTELTGTA